MLVTFLDANSTIDHMDRDRAIAVFIRDIFAFNPDETTFLCEFESIAV
jgi:hypothetical protein